MFAVYIELVIYYIQGLSLTWKNPDNLDSSKRSSNVIVYITTQQKSEKRSTVLA